MMTAKLISRRALGALASGMVFTGALVAVSGPAAAQVDFSGERITITVPFATGSNTDQWARMWAPFLEKYLPGEPTVLVKNNPGGGSLTAPNAFDSRAPRDGTEVIAGSTTTILNYIFYKNETVDYELRDWTPLVVTPQGSIVYARTETGVEGFGKDIAHDVRALREADLVVGLSKPIAAELRGVIAQSLLGIDDNVTYVFGVGAAERRQGVARSEFNLNMETPSGYQTTENLVQDDIALPVMTLGMLDAAGNVIRDPVFPDLPTVVEAYEAVNGSVPKGELHSALLAFIGLAVNASKGLYLPPETPEDVAAAWAEAIEKTIADPEFQQISGPVLEGYDIVTGEDAKSTLRAAINLDDKQRAWVKNWVDEKFGL
jgi:hypothetical protein